MSDERSAGRRTGVKVEIPLDRLSSRNDYAHGARRLAPEETQGWNRRNESLLNQYGIEIASVIELPLRQAARDARPGPLQTEHRDRLLLTCALGALSVSASGRGDLLDVAPAERGAAKLRIKENNDRNSTAAMTESLHALAGAAPGVSLKIAIGEGARKKPGERGGNPTLYAGQVIGPAGGAGRQGARYSVAVDTVEGTTKSTMFAHSCGTLLFVTEAPIVAVPDVYFDKCQLLGVDTVTVADPIERIVEAVMEARRTREVNFFALDRPRHPIDRMLALGANMRIDSDGDAYPVIAAGLSWGVYPDNLRPLDGVAGNIGGAAEMIASAAGAHYLGVRSTARFCPAKISTWETRYDFGPGEEEAIRAAGFDPAKVYRTEDLVPGLEDADGAFIAGAIADNWHIPGLDGAVVGGNFATVCVLFVGAAGSAHLYRITFAYRQPLEETVRMLTPVLTRLLGLAVDRIPAAVAEAVSDPARARRLRHEIDTSFYMHIREGAAPDEAGRIRLDLEAASQAESPEATAFLRAVVEAAPDWFAS